jgi:hypothetical protein
MVSGGQGRASAAASGRLLAELERLRTEFGGGVAARKAELLGLLTRARLGRADQLRRLHEVACYLRAYPDDERVLQRVERLLDGFSRRADLRRFRDELADSGLAGTAIHYSFFAEMASWLARRWPGQLAIDWDAVDEAHPGLDRLLDLLAHPAETPGLDDEALGPRAWLARMSGRRGSDAALVLRGLDARISDGAVREFLYEQLDLTLRLSPAPGTPSRTRAFVEGQPLHFQRTPLNRARPRLPADIRAKPAAVRSVDTAEGRRLIEEARAAMVVRHRDLDAFAYGDPRDVRLVDWGDGLQFAAIGMLPERRLMFESVYGFLTLKNGVPIGYVLTASLFGCSEVAYNVFETWRGSEAGFIYGRVLATARHLFGSDSFTVYPYQLGGEGNAEGLQSGAWWFYQKLGFRPRAKDVLALMRAELKRMQRKPGHRSSIATLKRLAAENVYYHMGRERDDVIGLLPMGAVGMAVTDELARRFGSDRPRALAACAKEAASLLGLRSRSGWSAGERLAWRRWAPVVLLLPGLQRWPAEQKRALVAVIRAKGGRRESDFVARFDRHRRLRNALLKVAQGVHLGRGLERLVALVLPLGRAALVGLLRQVDVGLELAQQLVDVPAHVVEVDLAVQQRAVGADDERAAQAQPGALVVNAEQAAQVARRVGAHRVLDGGQLLLVTLPGEVHELGVRADRDDLRAELLEAIVLLCQSSEFSRSDEGEVGRVEEQHRPLAGLLLGGQLEGAEVALGGLEGGQGEVGHGLPDLQGHIGHGDSSREWSCGRGGAPRPWRPSPGPQNIAQAGESARPFRAKIDLRAPEPTHAHTPTAGLFRRRLPAVPPRDRLPAAP